MGFGNRGPARGGAKSGQPAGHQEVVARPRTPVQRLPTYAELSKRQPGEDTGSFDASSRSSGGSKSGSGSAWGPGLKGPSVAIALAVGYQLIFGFGFGGTFTSDGTRANTVPGQFTQISRPKRSAGTEAATDRESTDPYSRSVDRAMQDSDVQRALGRMNNNPCSGEQKMTFSCEREIKEAADDYGRAITRTMR
jgi:hypothetical protein